MLNIYLRAVIPHASRLFEKNGGLHIQNSYIVVEFKASIGGCSTSFGFTCTTVKKYGMIYGLPDANMTQVIDISRAWFAIIGRTWNHSY